MPSIALLFLTLSSFILSSVRCHENKKEFSMNITRTLNGLLSASYDKRIRPDIGGAPTKVTVNMHIKSLGPVYEDDETYIMDVYFRQAWYDRRLGFDVPGTDELSMSWLFLDKIWKPDTFFLNGKKSHLHRITSPNKFIRLRKDGYLMYSMRLTVAARCKMHLRKFPLDSQKCPLLIGSYGYTSSDMIYNWDDSRVSIEDGVEMAQYDIVNLTTRSGVTILRGEEKYIVVEAVFYFRRAIGYFVLQVYVPCVLIVCCSWISFWITPSDVAGRTTLAVTTVLSITTLGFGGRSQLPKTSHATALDAFVIICFSFSFAVMIEYAVINFLDKLKKDIKTILEEKKLKEKEAEEEAERLRVIAVERDADLESQPEFGEAGKESASQKEFKSTSYTFLPNRWYSIPADLSLKSIRNEMFAWTPVTQTTTPSKSETLKEELFWMKRILMVPVNIWRTVHFLPMEMDDVAEERFQQIDLMARKMFPSAFVVILTLYVVLYGYYITDKAD